MGNLHFEVTSKPVKHQKTWAQTGMCWSVGQFRLMVSEEFTSDREPLRKLKNGQALRTEKQRALLRQ